MQNQFGLFDQISHFESFTLPSFTSPDLKPKKKVNFIITLSSSYSSPLSIQITFQFTTKLKLPDSLNCLLICWKKLNIYKQYTCNGIMDTFLYSIFMKHMAWYRCYGISDYKERFPVIHQVFRDYITTILIANFLVTVMDVKTIILMNIKTKWTFISL